MKVEDVDTTGAELGEGFGERCFQLLGGVVAGFGGIAFRRKGETPILPVRFSGEGFLGAANVGTGCVELIVAYTCWLDWCKWVEGRD